MNPPHPSSCALLVPSGATQTLQTGEAYSPDSLVGRFTERHGLPQLREQGWNLSRYTPGVYQLYKIQRPTTANEILAALHGIGVAYLPGSLLALIERGVIANMPLAAFLSVVQDELPLRRMLYLAGDTDSGSDHLVPDKLMITGYMDSNPVSTIYQPGLHVLVCCERF